MAVLTGSKIHENTGLRLYHRDVYIPEHLRGREDIIKAFCTRNGIEHTAHSFEMMTAKRLPDVSVEDVRRGSIYEYKIDGKELAEIGIRISFRDFDACVILTAEGYIKTIYGRRKDDVMVSEKFRYETK